MSDCDRTRDLMGPYLYADLQGEELAFVESHLADCPACRGEFAAAKSALALVPPDAFKASDETRARMLVAAQRLTARPARSAPQWLLKWGLAAAALIVGVLIGYQLPRSASVPADTTGTVVVHAGSASGGQEAAEAHKGQAPQREGPPSVDEGVERKELVDSQAEATGPQTAPPKQRPGPERRPARSLVASVSALRAPQPMGIDDVQVAEAVPIEDVR
ncbi:MAG: zf-HC2 domain-containing protein [Armatimonadetes bacterium]|nr:zf-HC2 domain-containing protein [Armatimonadota bacterium]